jgi:hypothetical protein
VSFAVITLCVASQRVCVIVVVVVVVYVIINSVRKLLDTPLYVQFIADVFREVDAINISCVRRPTVLT